MSLDVTVGTATSESYNSVSEADAYYAPDNHFIATWNAYSTTQKEDFLKLSARSIDRFESFRGVKQSKTQSLQFPRIVSRLADWVPSLPYGVTSLYMPRHPYGVDEIIEADKIPGVVKQAQLEMVIFLVNTRTSSAAIDGRELESMKLVNGLVELNYSGLIDSKIESSGGGGISAIKRLLIDVVAPLRWGRA